MSKARGLADLGNVYNDGALSNRNLIINGAMVHDQRNVGGSVSNSASRVYTLDRWASLGSSTSKFTVQQNAGSVTPPVGFKNYLGVTSSAATTVGASDYYVLQHRIEGYNAARLAFGTANALSVTISFWVRSSLTGTFSGSIQNSATDRSYPFTFAINSANTWEQKTVTIAGDTTGTWLTDNGIGVNLTIDLGSGSTFRGTADAWASSLFFGVTGSVQMVATSGATFYITGVQLEVGDTATPFEHRSYGQELALCQRYYERITETNTTETILGLGMAYSNTRVLAHIEFTVEKRANPTGSISNVADVQPLVANGSHVTPTGVSFLTQTKGCRMDITGLSGFTAGHCSEVRFNVLSTNPYIAFDAEL